MYLESIKVKIYLEFLIESLELDTNKWTGLTLQMLDKLLEKYILEWTDLMLVLGFY